MIVGHVYIVYTSLARPPKDKITICLCSSERLFFWINTKPQRHGIGQFPLTPNDHSALTHDCFLDCSRVTTFAPKEMAAAEHRGPISVNLAKRIIEFLIACPPKTLSKRYIEIAISELTSFCGSAS